MTIKYSALHRGFFDTSLHAEIPDDAVSISPARHAALLAGQSEGYQIEPDKRGRPQLRAIAPTTLAGARAKQIKLIKREAARRIDVRMPIWRQINALRNNADPGFHEIDHIRAASDLIEEQISALVSFDAVEAFPVKDNPLWPEFDLPAAKD